MNWKDALVFCSMLFGLPGFGFMYWAQLMEDPLDERSTNINKIGVAFVMAIVLIAIMFVIVTNT